MKTTVEILKDARELISDPSRWTQGQEARGRFGQTVTANSAFACAWCTIGAVSKVSASEHVQDVIKAFNYLGDALPGENRLLSTFNDSHGHADVMALFDRAIERATRSDSND